MVQVVQLLTVFVVLTINHQNQLIFSLLVWKLNNKNEDIFSPRYILLVIIFEKNNNQLNSAPESNPLCFPAEKREDRQQSKDEGGSCSDLLEQLLDMKGKSFAHY